MQNALFPNTTTSANEHVLRALQLNKDNQAAVKTQIEQLDNKLAALDKLLVCAVSYIPLGETDRVSKAVAEEHDEGDFEPEVGGYISIPGSSAISAPITSKELSSEVGCALLSVRGLD